MMRCINFDGQFERYATEWMRQNAAQFHNNVDAMEAKMPDVYLQWLNEPADWLDGATPGAYFLRFDDAAALTEMMCEYHRRGVPVPDQLLERLTSLGAEAEEALLALLAREDAPQESVLTAVSLLGEMESSAAHGALCGLDCPSRGARRPRGDGRRSADGHGAAVVAPVLAHVEEATPSGKETFLDTSAIFRGTRESWPGLALLRERPEKTALFASLLGKLGDPRAIPALQQALDAPGIHYLDYLELRNAVEALGGDVRCERDFSGDPYYESLRRME